MAKTLIAFLCIVMSVGVVKSNVERFWADKQTLRPGETLNLMCEFSDLDSHDPTHFYKHYPENRTAAPLTDSYTLADGLPSRFQFAFKDAESGRNPSQTLTITNVVPGDSGNYSCFMRDINKNNTAFYRYLNITVQDEPDTIKLYLDDIEMYNGSNTVPLKFLQAHRLRCETTRSNPGANITITTGNGRPVHLTSVNVSNATYELADRDQTNDFVIPIYRNTSVQANSWVFDMEAYEKPVVCLAKVDKDTPGIMTSFIPVVADGPPQIECNDTVYARDGVRQFVINCTSYAKPSLSKALFYYVKDKVNYTIQGFPLNIEHPSTDGKDRGVVKVLDPIRSTLHLTIDTVNLKDPSSFNFYVANDYGQVIHQVTIKDPATASSSTALSTCFIAVLLTWLVGVGIRSQL